MKKTTTQTTNFVQLTEVQKPNVTFASSKVVTAISKDVMKKHYDVLKKLADYDKQK